MDCMRMADSGELVGQWKGLSAVVYGVAIRRQGCNGDGHVRQRIVDLFFGRLQSSSPARRINPWWLQMGRLGRLSIQSRNIPSHLGLVESIVFSRDGNVALVLHTPGSICSCLRHGHGNSNPPARHRRARPYSATGGCDIKQRRVRCTCKAAAVLDIAIRSHSAWSETLAQATIPAYTSPSVAVRLYDGAVQFVELNTVKG
jgi:hypothetical protein